MPLEMLCISSPADATSLPTMLRSTESRKPAPATPMIDAIRPSYGAVSVCCNCENGVVIPISAIALA
jgi:hypothetical protein